MASFDQSKYLFLAGLLLLFHGAYMAFSMRDRLQMLHHRQSVIPAVDFTATADAAMTATMLPIAVEVVVGMVAATVGYAWRSEMVEARLCDLTRYARYDHQMNTGVGFIHFNHRGSMASKGKAAAAVEKTREAKKDD